MSYYDPIKQSKCRTCGGRGWVLAPVKIVCSGCLGGGQVQDRTCLSCAGCGVTFVETEILCDQCQGVGSISIETHDSTHTR